MITFPERFVILRTQSSRGPYWQLLQSRHISSGLSDTESFYEVSSPSWITNTTPISEPHYTNSSSITKQRVQIRTQSGELSTLKYWRLPMVLVIENHNIPVLHFEYKAWIPLPSYRIPISNSSEALRRHNEYVQRCSDIDIPMNNREQDVRRRLFDDLPQRPPTPPRYRRGSDSSIESVLTVYDSIHPLDFPPLPSSPPTSPVLARPLPIPELVGHLLIQNAVQGEDTCPISAIPYSELKKISATSCFHVFDSESIRTWLQDHTQCPVCRNAIANMITKEIKN